MADGKMIIDIKIDASGAEKGVKGLGDKLGSMAKDGLKLFTKGIGAASVVLGRLGAYALKGGSDFEEGMSKVKAVSGATGEEMVLLSDKAKEMGAKTKFSATESAEAMLYMGMAGWKSQQMIDGLPGIMNLAAASGEELGLVSDIVTDALTAFGLKAKDSAGFADLLASASSNSNTNVALLGESFKYVAPVAGALGVSAKDTAFALGLMANAGIKGSQSGTALRTSFTNLAKPTENMYIEMNKLGISLTDSNGKVKEGKQLFDELRTKFGPLTKAQQASSAATIFGKEAMSGMLAVINASDDEYNTLYDNLTNCAGAAENTANVMNDNLKGQVVLLKSALKGLGIQLYESIDNPLKDIVKSANGMIETLSKAFKEGGFTALTESIGNVLSQIIVGIAESDPKIIDSAIMIIQSFITGIQNSLPSIIYSALKIVNSLVFGILTVLPQLLQMGMQAIAQLAMGIGQQLPTLIPLAIQCIMQLVITLYDNLPLMIEAGLQLLQGLATGIVDAIPILITILPQVIDSAINYLAEALPLILNMGLNILLSLIDGIVQCIPQLIAMLPEIIDTIINFITQNLPQIIQMGVTVLLALINGLGNAIPQLIAMLPQIINTIVYTLIEHLPEIILAGVQILIALANGLIQGIPQLGSGILEIVRTIFSAFEVDWEDIGINIVKGVWEGIKGLRPWLGEKVSGFFKGTVSTAKQSLDINSPSRVFRDQVGVMMAKGVGVGFEDETENIQDSMSKNLADLTAKMTSTVDYEVVNASNGIVARNNQGTNTDVTTLADIKDGDVFIVKNYMDSEEISEYTYKKVDGKFALAGKRVR